MYVYIYIYAHTRTDAACVHMRTSVHTSFVTEHIKLLTSPSQSVEHSVF